MKVTCRHLFQELNEALEYECYKCGQRATPSFHLRPECDVALVTEIDAQGWASGYIRRRYLGSDWDPELSAFRLRR